MSKKPEVVLENYNQVRMHCRELGYVCSFRKVKADHERGALVGRRGGGFAAGTVEQWARLNLKPQVAEGGKADRPAIKAEAPEGVRAKAVQEARYKEALAEKTELQLKQMRGELVPKSLYHKALAARWAWFSSQIDAAMTVIADQVAALCGADTQAAARIVELAGGDAADPDAAAAVAGHFEALKPEILDLMLKEKYAWMLAWAAEGEQVPEMDAAVKGEAVEGETSNE